jgi:2-hydroxy-6-oxonona-2,4-dienedioate hydrolase
MKALEHDMLRRVKQIEQPCLIVRGERDPIASQHWVEALAREMRNAEVRTIRGAGHALNYNSPRIVIPEMIRFWRERGVSV